MIARIWHGWTTHENASRYEHLLKTEVFPAIEHKKVKGYRKITLLKRVMRDEVAFVTTMLFDSIQSVKEFAGEDYEESYVPEKARALLSRLDQRAQHYEIIDEINY